VASQLPDQCDAICDWKHGHIYTKPAALAKKFRGQALRHLESIIGWMIQPSRHLLNLNPFLTAKLNGLYFKVCRILPSLSRIFVLGHMPPPLVRRRCPLKRGNYIFRVLVLVIRLLIQHIHPELWKSQGPRSLKLKPNF
jgi:hypothetical protein